MVYLRSSGGGLSRAGECASVVTAMHRAVVMYCRNLLVIFAPYMCIYADEFERTKAKQDVRCK